MQTKFVEVTNSNRNWGKFLLFRFDKEEWAHQSAITGNSLLREVGWDRDDFVMLDCQTGEAARFRKGGLPSADLKKHQIWVCPMFEPFLNWLYKQDMSDLLKLPNLVDLPDAEFAFSGYRREGPSCENPSKTSESSAPTTSKKPKSKPKKPSKESSPKT